MGTASTMACIAETARHVPARHRRHPRRQRRPPGRGRRDGTRRRRLIDEPHHPASQVITAEQAVENAFRVLMALGGSTNAIVHLTAIAGRLGIRVSNERLNAISDETPVLVDLKPVGEGYMEDFHAAGGVGAVLRELRPLLHLDTIDVEGRTAGRAPGRTDRMGGPRGDPPLRRPRIARSAGLIALHGSAGPGRRDLQARRRHPRLVRARGPRRGVHRPRGPCRPHRRPGARRDSPDDVLVLQNAGPHAAGMPEAGYLPIPKKLAQAGVKDMVRISDARMSGTAFGTIVLHVAPEAAASAARSARCANGDRIRLSVRGEARSISWWTRPRSPAASPAFTPPPVAQRVATRRCIAAP